jgi:hypothetical protein
MHWRRQGLFRQPLTGFCKSFFSSQRLPPLNFSLASIGLCHRSIEHLDGRPGDIGADAVTLNENNEGVVRNRQGSVIIESDQLAFLS